MTLATAICVIETLMAFPSLPVDMVSDGISGFYVACDGEIFRFIGDSVVASVSRVGEKFLSGISCVAFSGQFLYAAVPMEKKVYQFARDLSFRGEIKTDIFPAQIAVSHDGALWIYDPDSRQLEVLFPFGDPPQKFQVSVGRAKLVGLFAPDVVERCFGAPPEEVGLPGFLEIPAFRGDSSLWLGVDGFELEVDGELPVGICSGEPVFSDSGKIFTCRDTLAVPFAPEKVVCVAVGGEEVYYMIAGRFLLRCLAE